jgi:signal transduction histidine kinase
MRPGISDSTAQRFRAYLAQHDASRGPAVGAFDAFFAAASAALLLVDDDLRCVQVNQRFASATGLPLDAHRHRSLTDILTPSLEPKLREVLRTGNPIDKLPFELRGQRFLGTFFPIYGEDRGIIGLGGIVIDISEHERLEAKLRGAIEMRERVLAVVSHDLRNPLGTIQLAMSTMPESVRSDPEAVRRIQIVERATKTMEALIGDLLDMATIHSGTLTLQFHSEHADSIVKEALELHAPLAHEKGLALIDETHLEGVHVRCDRSRMMQVFSNLLGNAIKFCRRGDTIRVRGHADERSLVIEVEDTGPGIPPEDIPHLFEAYWSTARGRQRGTGLGLYICHAIVEAHAGRLSVASTVGSGTSFRLILPVG